NENLLRRGGIRVIPTLIFIDRTGQGVVYTGVMELDALRAELETLAEE
ncbi:MAG: thiol reductase thioredoxin, partial [Anaerolineae bacterium]|nr:thiol reductase thioredoxin [Anaerolineae bacterium]